MKQFSYFKSKFEMARFIEKLSSSIGCTRYRNVVPFVDSFSRDELESMLIELFSKL